jgi:hypothetical protein
MNADKQVAAFTMVLIYFTVPQKALEGDYKQKVKQMDWLGGFLSLTMTVCLLVRPTCDDRHLRLRLIPLGASERRRIDFCVEQLRGHWAICCGWDSSRRIHLRRGKNGAVALVPRPPVCLIDLPKS